MANLSLRRLVGLASAATALTANLTFAQGTISQANWTVLHVDSEDTVGGDYSARNAFDGDPSTMWVTEWFLSSPTPPHELSVDLGGVHDVNGFRYLPRQDGVPHGSIAQFQFFVSMDGVTWGTPVAAQTFGYTGQVHEVRFATKAGRYVRLRALSEVNSRPWTAVAELNVLSEGGGPFSRLPIPQTNWTVRSVDSQESEVEGYLATNAFDGDPYTMWATRWNTASPPPPHELQINLGAVYEVDGFRYLPRQDGAPQGRIGQYTFYVSMDGANWGTAVATGTFPNSGTEQEVSFTPKTGRFVRLRVTREINDQPWTTVAELNVLGRWDGVDQPPSVSLTALTPGPYTPPASVTLRANAQDPDGFVTRTEFFSGSTLFRTDTSAPYEAVVSGLGSGTHSFAAVAHDNGDNTGTSNTLTITVGGTGGHPTRAVFNASPNHDQAVTNYVLDIFTNGSNPTNAQPVASLDLGKPVVVNGECAAEVGALIAALSPGTYIGTVTAVGNGGTARSAASPTFQR